MLGYTGQGRFLINCGLLDGMEGGVDSASLAERAMVQKLIAEHEMGELFKVIGFVTNSPVQPYGGWQAMGFVQGDRTHTL